MISRFLPDICLVVALAGSPSLLAEPVPVRPNIILILADDLGWKDAGFRGSEYFETPRLDALAAEGVEFTRAYASPSCAPTRAALFSGQYSPRTGVFMVSRSDRGDKTKQRLVPVPNREDLPPEVVTLAEALGDAGYATALIGKWHLGGGDTGPQAHGFQTNIAGYDEGTPPTYFSPYKIPTLKDGPVGEYLTDRLTDEAIAWITQEKEEDPERPFFLYLAHYAPHVPIEAKKEMEEAFAAKAPDGLQNNPAYAAMVKSLDEGVGKLMDALDRLGLREETYVIFLSDNGGQMGITAQPPLREGKGWLTEGGVRVPMIIRGPGGRNGARCDSPVRVVDIYPTVLDWAGLDAPEGHTLDGISLAGLTRDPAAGLPREDIFWHFPGYQPWKGGFRITPSSMIVSGKWKLIERFEDGGLELYDLEADIGETTNLAGAKPAKAAELRARLAAWRESVGAKVPTDPNPEFRDDSETSSPESKGGNAATKPDTTAQIAAASGKTPKGEPFVFAEAPLLPALSEGGFAAEPAFVDTFDPGWTAAANGWRVATWKQNGTKMAKERCSADDNGHLVQTVAAGEPLRGGSIQSTREFGYGRWVARVKPSSVPGLLNSIFTKDWDDLTTPDSDGDGAKSEVDIEFVTHTFASDSPEVHLAIHLKNHHPLWHVDIPLDFNPSEDFHEWGFDILPDRVVWHVDGKVLHTWKYTDEHRVDPDCEFFFNSWTRKTWLKGPPETDAEYLIDWVKFYPLVDAE